MCVIRDQSTRSNYLYLWITNAWKYSRTLTDGRGREGKGAKRLSDALSIYMQIRVCGRIGARVLLFFCLYSAWQISTARYSLALWCAPDTSIRSILRNNVIIRIPGFLRTSESHSSIKKTRRSSICALVPYRGRVGRWQYSRRKTTANETRTRLREKSCYWYQNCVRPDIT